MPFYKFSKKDVYINTLKAFPEVKYFMTNGQAYYNNTPNLSGSFTGSIRCTDPGSISLYELNIDRKAGDYGYITQFVDPGTGELVPLKSVQNTGLIYQFMVKDATRLSFNSVTSKAFSKGQVGEVFTGSFPYTARITKEYYNTTTARHTAPILNETEGDGISVAYSGSVSHLRALKNTLNHYTYLSPHYAYSSSILRRNFDNIQVGLVCIPTIFYGSQIKPGSVQLDFYVTGTMVGRLQDKNHNGVLYQTAPAGSTGSGSVAGVVLYNEGFMVLTGSWNMSSPTHTENYGTANNYPNWVNFAQTISSSNAQLSPKSAFLLQMSGTTRTETMTMFATAPKGMINQSNNPTFVDFYTGSFGVTASTAYVENQVLPIKNVVSSAYNTPTGSFQRTTYISKIGIYDDDMNLIAIAKPATPIKKVDSRDFTFKIELDI